MTFTSMIGRFLATLLGVAFVAVSTTLDVEYFGNGQLTEWNSLMAAVVAVNVATALSLVGAGAAWNRGLKPLSIGFLILFICGVFYSLQANLDRAGQWRDGQVHQARSTNAGGDALRQAYLDLKAEAKAEGARGGCKTQCQELWKRAEAARLAWVQAGAGAKVEEASASQRALAALVPGWKADDFRLSLPASLSFALFLSGTLFTSFGLNGARIQTHQEVIVPTDPVLAVLQRNGGVLNNRTLAKALRCDESTASRRVARLVNDGQVVKIREGQEVKVKLIAAS